MVPGIWPQLIYGDKYNSTSIYMQVMKSTKISEGRHRLRLSDGQFVCKDVILVRDEPVPILAIIQITKWVVQTDGSGNKVIWIREICEDFQTATEKVGQPISLPILCAQQNKTADINTDVVSENADNTADSNVGECGTNEAVPLESG